MAPPPGWYPDARIPGQQRWWDGSKWTEHVQVLSAPLGPLSPPVMPPGFVPDPSAGNWFSQHIAATVVIAVIILLVMIQGFSGLGHDSSDDSGRKFSESYKIHIDADRVLSVKLSGSYAARSDKSDADAGKTEVLVDATGKAEIQNISDGRDTDSYKQGIEIFLPSEMCPGWIGDKDEGPGDYCSYDIFNVNIGPLDAGEKRTIRIDDEDKVAQVKVDQGEQLVNDLMGDKSVLLAADRVWFFGSPDKYNPTCDLPLVKGEKRQGKWVTYFSENSDVNACSTEARTS